MRLLDLVEEGCDFPAILGALDFEQALDPLLTSMGGRTRRRWLQAGAPMAGVGRAPDVQPPFWRTVGSQETSGCLWTEGGLVDKVLDGRQGHRRVGQGLRAIHRAGLPRMRT